jgi:(p)ppGpp synthase/HD superfamily hydrolase
MITKYHVRLAKELAVFYHRDQKYGKREYIKHILDVCNRVAIAVAEAPEEWPLKCETVAALHDILEDTECEAYQLDGIFGEEITDAVAILSKNFTPRGQSYISNVRQNPLALAVKIADTECNLHQSLNDNDQRRIEKYTKQLEELLK